VSPIDEVVSLAPQASLPNAGPDQDPWIGEHVRTRNSSLLPSYREEVEAEFAGLVASSSTASKRHYGMFPHIDVFGVVAAVNYTPPDAHQKTTKRSHTTRSVFRLSDQKPWVQVGVLRAALQTRRVRRLAQGSIPQTGARHGRSER